MYVKEAVTFQLLEVGGDPFYRGSFEKLNDEWTLEKDIQKKLNQLVKKENDGRAGGGLTLQNSF